MMDLAPKSAQKLWIEVGECSKIYVPELKAIVLWFFYKDITGRKPTIVKIFDLIEDNTKALETTNKPILVQYIKDNILEINMEVAMVDGCIE